MRVTQPPRLGRCVLMMHAITVDVTCKGFVYDNRHRKPAHETLFNSRSWAACLPRALCRPVTFWMLLPTESPETPEDLNDLRRQLAGYRRAQETLDTAGLKRMGELEFDLAQREKKFRKTGR